MGQPTTKLKEKLIGIGPLNRVQYTFISASRDLVLPLGQMFTQSTILCFHNRIYL